MSWKKAVEITEKVTVRTVWSACHSLLIQALHESVRKVQMTAMITPDCPRQDETILFP